MILISDYENCINYLNRYEVITNRSAEIKTTLNTGILIVSIKVVANLYHFLGAIS